MRSSSLDEEGTIINSAVYGNVGNVDHPNATAYSGQKNPGRSASSPPGATGRSGIDEWISTASHSPSIFLDEKRPNNNCSFGEHLPSPLCVEVSPLAQLVTTVSATKQKKMKDVNLSSREDCSRGAGLKNPLADREERRPDPTRQRVGRPTSHGERGKVGLCIYRRIKSQQDSPGVCIISEIYCR
jgi:hypothetical protein